MSIENILSIFGVLILFFGQYVYIKEIFLGINKPHPFSWLGWSLATFVGALVQVVSDGGIGSAVLFGESIIAFLIFVLALKYGEKKFYKIDYISFIVGFVAIILWVISKNPLWTVLLITIADLVMFIPTFRKTYEKPFEEELTEYYTSGIAYLLSIFAMNKISFLTIFYPLVLIIANFIFISITLYRRRMKNKL